MKKHTHPVSETSHYKCGNCGTEISVSSTVQATTSLDVCSNCHPAYLVRRLKKHQAIRLMLLTNVTKGSS